MSGMLEVWLEDLRVGTLSNLTGDDNLFSFDAQYADDLERPILSQAYVAATGSLIMRIPRTHRVAPAFFANLLAEEGSALRSIVARQHSIKVTRDFPFLRALGLDLPGAVVLREIDQSGEPLGASGIVLEDGERPLRFSLAGLQTKFSASFVHDRLTIPMEGVGGSWIVKLPNNAYPELPGNEFNVMSLARSLGLNVPETRLVDLDLIDGIPKEVPALRHDEPRLAYAIRRFDRSATRRVHGEDFNQIRNAKPEEKYEGRASD